MAGTGIGMRERRGVIWCGSGLGEPENAWETLAPHVERWKNLYDGLTPQSRVFPLEPYIRSKSNKFALMGPAP
ncbi:hypothetical protein VUR80DRAFT_2780 [Thermomyces stellatus]